MSKILLMANVNRSQIEITKTHYNIKSIPITVDDAVMNGVLYSKAENAKGLPTMVGNPITLGHPVIDGQNKSAHDGEALDDFYSGGTVRKVFNKSGVWYANASIKKALLNAQDGGKEYADLLDGKESIGVSTGLSFDDNQITGTNSRGDGYTKSAINQQYDHLAMLANEAPAGGDDTVMRFNVADIIPEEKSSLADKVKSLLAWAANKGYTEQEGVKPETLINNNEGDSIMDRTKIIALLASKNISVNAEISDEDLEAKLTEAFNAKADPAPAVVTDALTVESMEIAINTLIKPLQETITELQSNITANADKELEGLRVNMKAMKTNRLSDSLIEKMDAKEMNDHLASNGVPAFNSVGSHHINQDDSTLEMSLPGTEA